MLGHTPRGGAARPAAPSTTRSLHDRLLRSLAASPDRAVARWLPDGTALDLDTFERRVLGAERCLVRLGSRGGFSGTRVEPDAGTLVLLSGRPTPAWLVALTTLWKRGYVPLLADADLSRHEIATLVEQLRPAACLLDRDVDPPGGRRVELRADLEGLHAWLPASRRRPAAAVVPPTGAGAVLLTSGTSGRPRGVVLTPDQLLADTRQITAACGVTPDQTLVTALPLSHAYGFGHVLMPLVRQGTRPLFLEHPLPALLQAGLSERGDLVFPGTPYLYDLLLNSPSRSRCASVVLFLSAGAPLPQRLAAAFKKRFRRPIRTFYGTTETGGIAFDGSREGVLPDGCVGRPIAGVEVTLRPRPHLDDGIGCACVASAAVALGYLPADARAGLRAGRFETADLARFDGDGRLHLTGRADRRINVGGRKVDPGEVEVALRSVPGVRDAVVFGVADARRGEAIGARVAGPRGLTRETLLAACRDRLAAWKIPRRIELCDRLPVDGRGKIAHAASGGRPARRRHQSAARSSHTG